MVQGQGSGGFNFTSLLILFVTIISFSTFSLYFGNYAVSSVVLFTGEYLVKYKGSTSLHGVDNETLNKSSKPTQPPSTIIYFHHPTFIPTPNQWKAKSPTKQPSKKARTLDPTPLPTPPPSRLHPQTTDSRCYLSSNESCSLTTFEFGETIEIFPPSDSKCGCIEPLEQYSFVVTKGDHTKVLIYFQGGGLCWDAESLRQEKCRTYLNAPAKIGILDRKHEKNPFRNYTTVTVPYCSGDFFLGDSSDVYSDGTEVKYRGARDTSAILQWLRNEHQSKNYLSHPSLNRLVIAGSSAGSIGALYWSGQFSKNILAENTNVISDSMILYSPPTYDEVLYKKWNLCTTDIFAQLNISCNSQRSHHAGLLSGIISTNTHVSYFFISSMRDWTALSYYNAIGASLSHSSHLRARPKDTSEDEYYSLIRSFLYTLSKTNHLSNVFFYLIDSYHHIYLNRVEMFTATPESEVGVNLETSIGTPLHLWLESIATDQNNVSSICEDNDCKILL